MSEKKNISGLPAEVKEKDSLDPGLVEHAILVIVNKDQSITISEIANINGVEYNSGEKPLFYLASVLEGAKMLLYGAAFKEN